MSTCGNVAAKFTKKVLFKTKEKKLNSQKALEIVGKLFSYLGTTKTCMLLNDGIACKQFAKPRVSTLFLRNMYHLLFSHH